MIHKTLIFLVNLAIISAQSEVPFCRYFYWGTTYTCDLKINNPNGLNNFTNVNGVHLDGKTDADVEQIYNQSPSGASTTVVPLIFCDKFKNLKTFYPSQGTIQTVDENSFKNCKNLVTIQFFKNKISYVHVDAFKENYNLTYLSFSNNSLTYLSENIFSSLAQLKTLYLDRNRFTDFSKNLFRPLKSLEILDISSNSITTPRPEWFLPLENLRAIYLGFNKISELPSNLFTPLKNATHIYLNGNQLTTLHAKSFGNLPALNFMIVSQNKITAIDEKILDNTGAFLWEMEKNVCIDEAIVVDHDPAKIEMRQTMKKCLDNYELLVPGCQIGNLDARVCKLESNNQEMSENLKYLYLEIAGIKNENLKMQPIIYEVQKYLEKQKKIEEKLAVLAAAIDKLLGNIYV